MIKYRIYPMIILFALLTSFFLPNYYKNIFGKKIDFSRINYSPLDKDFIKSTYKAGTKRKMIYSNINDSKIYTFEEYEEKLPFTYMFSLIKENRFPEKFNKYLVNIKESRKEIGFSKVSTKAINNKSQTLFPLFESNPKRGLKLPNDLFRIGKEGITFINTRMNKENKEKSEKYNKKLLKLNAHFPIVEAFGNPTTMKAFDEGYFIKDSKNQIFHLKQIDNLPKINKVKTDKSIKYIQVKEDKRKEYYGIVITKNNLVYLLMYKNYELVKLPIDNFNHKSHSIKIKTTPVNRIISINHIDYISEEKIIETYVTDLKYKLIKKNIYKYSLKQSYLYEKVKDIVFPFKLSIVKENEAYTNFKIKNISKISFAFYLTLGIFYFLYLSLKNKKIKTSFIVNSILISFGGIYSILSLILFGKFLEKKL